MACIKYFYIHQHYKYFNVLSYFIYFYIQLLIYRQTKHSSMETLASDNWHTKVVKYSFFEHLLRFSPTNSFFLYNFLNLIVSIVMRIQNAKHYLTQFPVVIYSHNAVCVFGPSIHDWSSYFLQMISECFCVLDNILAVVDMQNSAVEVR